MQVIIRNAKVSDINTIVEMQGNLADYHRKLDKYFRPGKEISKSFRKYLKVLMKKKNAKVLVAEYESKVVGYTIGKIEKSKVSIVPKKIGKITDLFILPEHRNKGIGKALVSELIQWFKKRKIEYVEIGVHSKNKLALTFWKKHGFKEYMKIMRIKLE